jgi:hypothetical protein
MNRTSLQRKTISAPLPTVATKLPKPVHRTVKSLFLPRSNASSEPTPQRPMKASLISKSLISSPMPVSRPMPGFSSGAETRSLRPPSDALGPPASGLYRVDVSRQAHPRPSTLAMKRTVLPFIARPVTICTAPDKSHAVSSTFPRTHAPRSRPQLSLPPATRAPRMGCTSSPTPSECDWPQQKIHPLSQSRAFCTSQSSQDSPLLGSHEDGLDCEDLLSIRLPYDQAVVAPPFTPLISPHSPASASSNTFSDLLGESVGLDSCPTSPHSTYSADFCPSPDSTSSIVWRYSPTPVEKRPALTLEIPGSVSLRDEITRGIVSAVDHMLDDDLLLFPPSAITPLRRESTELPAICHLRLSHTGPSSRSAPRNDSIRDPSCNIPLMHRDVWAAYRSLRRTNVEPDIDGYFVHAPSPV